MLGDRLIDLDELALHCRNDQARTYVAEAVACYRAGAFRACIVATWVAVVFDIVHKLHELDLAGDAEARQQISQFEEVRKQLDVKKSLDFENNVLKLAKDKFEFISFLEYMDLERLKDDRNRCAHPSMNAPNEPYQPTAELARYHLRSAVMHLLQHPPVQGKAALENLQADIDSPYFPVGVPEAVRHLQYGPLAKPRGVLTRNLVLILTKRLLQDEDDPARRQRYATALNAAREMHRAEVEKVLHDDLSKLFRKIEDAKLWRAVSFLQLVPDCWSFLDPDMQGQIERYLDALPTGDLALALLPALEVNPLKARAATRLNKVTEEELTTLLTAGVRGPIGPLADRAVELYVSSKSGSQANARVFHLLIPLAPYLQPVQLARIVQAAPVTREKGGTWGLNWLYENLPRHGHVGAEELKGLLATQPAPLAAEEEQAPPGELNLIETPTAT